MAQRSIANKQGEKEVFRREKLYRSIRNPALEADYDEDAADELAATAVEEVIDWMEAADDVITVRELEDVVIEYLQEQDPDVAFLYETHLDLN